MAKRKSILALQSMQNYVMLYIPSEQDEKASVWTRYPLTW